jgi:uncharacterized protein (TIGR02231 family)
MISPNTVLSLKRWSLLLLIPLLTPAANAAEKRIPSKVDSVKFFFSGVEIKRKADVSLTKGNTTVIFDGISEDINPNGIQMMTKEEVTIISLSYQINRSNDPKFNPTNPQLHIWQDSVDWLNDRISLCKVKIEACNHEHQLLLSTKPVTQQQISMSEFEKMLELNRVRGLHLLTEKYKNEKDIKQSQTTINQLQAKIHALQKELKEQWLKDKPRQPRGEIIVTLYAEKPLQNVPVQFSYIAKVAGWIPMYDVKADFSGKKTTLIYKAEIAQQTGEDWGRTKVSLSSLHPDKSISIPNLSPEYLTFTPPPVTRYDMIYNQKDGRLLFSNAPKSEFEADKDGIDQAFDDMKRLPARMTEKSKERKDLTMGMSKDVKSPDFMIDFEIPMPVIIDNNGKGQVFAIKEYSLPLDFQFVCVPKMEPSVYLTGMTDKWQELQILPAYANMFLNNTFSGKIFLNPGYDNDTLRFSFGKDHRVIAGRKLVKDFSKTRLFGTNKTESYEYEIQINNTYDHDIHLRVIDQIPISKIDLIKVEGVQYSLKPKSEGEDGIIHWDIKMTPKQIQKIRVNYNIVSPKGRQVY